MELAPKVKWYKTTGGKVGIIAGVVIFLTATGFAIASTMKRKKPASESDAPPADGNTFSNPPADTKPSGETATAVHQYSPAELPNGGAGCGDVKRTFDRVYDYVKCNGIWWTISKDRKKIPNWKSLADNKIATDLLNNKYPG